MTRAVRRVTAVVLGGLVGLQAAVADMVTLADGSRLVGVVRRMSGDRLLVETDFAGTLELDVAKIEAVETDHPVNVEMVSGDRLIGNVERIAEDGRCVVRTAMGLVPINFIDVECLWAVGEKSPQALVYEAEFARLKEEVEAQRPRWSANVEIGANYKEGNNDVLEARGRIELKRTTLDDMLLFWASGDYGEQDDRRSTAEAKGGATYEYSLTDRWFWQAKFSLEYDEFEDLDLRAIVGTGPGFYWIKKPDHELRNRVGLGYQHESFMDGTTTNEGLFNLGLDYRLDLADWLRFTHTTDYYPTFEELDNYRLVVDNALIIPLADSEVWKLKLGALYEYDSHPRPGVERLDQTYYANMLLEVK